MQRLTLVLLLILGITGCINIEPYHYLNEITTRTPATINITNKGDFPFDVLMNGEKITTLQPTEQLTITTRRLK